MELARALQGSGTFDLMHAVVERVDDDGRAWVTVEGATEAVPADSLVCVASQEDAIGRRALVLIEAGAAPVIIGLVRRTIVGATPDASGSRTLTGASVYADGKRVAIDATEEILLTCGDSSIRLDRNGKITVKGLNVVSRASASNSVKGATVRIN